MSKTDTVIQKVALPLIALAAVLLIVLYIGSVKDTSKENNAYIRVINCIISIPATTRDQNDIEHCYSTVEHDLGVKLQRYDSSK